MIDDDGPDAAEQIEPTGPDAPSAPIARSRQARRQAERQAELQECRQRIAHLLEEYNATFAVAEQITFPAGQPRHTHIVTVIAI